MFVVFVEYASRDSSDVFVIQPVVSNYYYVGRYVYALPIRTRFVFNGSNSYCFLSKGMICDVKLWDHMTFTLVFVALRCALSASCGSFRKFGIGSRVMRYVFALKLAPVFLTRYAGQVTYGGVAYDHLASVCDAPVAV